MQNNTINIFENEIQLYPQSFQSWWNYINYFNSNEFLQITTIYKRALQHIPGSYKMWYNYLLYLLNWYKNQNHSKEMKEMIEQTFENCLMYMRKMPVIWTMYIKLMMETNQITKMRRIFDRSLQTLSIGQHNDLWKIVIDYVSELHAPKLFSHLVLRHLQLDKSRIKEYINICMQKGKDYYSLAFKLLIEIIGNDSIYKRREEYEMIIEIIQTIDIDDKQYSLEKILRKGIEEFYDDCGNLWVGLSLLEIKKGRIETGIVILEEALQKVLTMKDLYIVRECYQRIIMNCLSNETIDKQDKEIMRMRMENIMGNEEIQMNMILLKRNPYNIEEWMRRSRLYIENGDMYNAVITLIEAIKTISKGNEKKGKKYELWNELIGLYLKVGKKEQAKQLFIKAKADLLSKKDESEIWYQMIKYELDHNNIQHARELCEEATLKDSRVKNERRIWESYLQIEEQSNNIMGKWCVYEKMIELQIITGNELLNYIEEKRKHNQQDEIWNLYERGIQLFPYPIVGYLYLKYINEWCNLYGETKKERTRDLFESAIQSAPNQYKQTFYDKYREYEQSHNQYKRVLQIFKEEVQHILPEKQCEIWIEYAQYTHELYGYDETKMIYFKAIEQLGRNDQWKICLSFAEYLEQEEDIEGVREIYVLGCKRCSVKDHSIYWNQWKEFEEKYGNETTMKDYYVEKKTVMNYFAEDN